MKLRKVNILTEEKDNNEIAFEEQEKFKKNREDVIKSRTPEKVEKTGDIENAIKNSKEILNTKVPAVNTKKNNFSILESLLNEGFDFDVKSKVFTVDVTNRTALKKLCECLNKINTGYLINRSTKEGYRYCVTIKESFKRKESINESKEVNESKEDIQAQINWCESALNNPNGRAAMDAKANYGSNWKKYVKADLEKFKKMLADSEKKDESLNEEVSDLAYNIADVMATNLTKLDSHIISRDEVEEQFALAIREVSKIDNIWEIIDTNGVANIDGKDYDVDELETDVRGILGYKGWATIFEGEYEGGLTDSDENSNESLKEGKVKIVSVEQGTCPYCNGNNIDYNAADFTDDMVCYPAHCNDCGRDFEEWYKLNFAGHNVGKDLDIEAEVGQEVELDETLKEAKGIEHNPEEEKKFVGLDECDKSVKEDICPECGKESCVCGPATDKDAEYQKTFAKDEHDKQVEKELTGKDLDEDLKLLADINDYKPWAGAVDLWNEIVDADKVEELEFALEDLYPDGLTITELNDLLWFEQDFVREQIGLAKAEEDDDTVEESFEEKRQRIKESFDK